MLNLILTFTPALKIRDYLKSGDVVLGNLEGPIAPEKGAALPGMIFRAEPGTENALKKAGFTLLSLANNHTLDLGPEGLKETLKNLQQVGIYYFGAGNTEKETYAPKFVTVKGLRLAFLAYCDPFITPSFFYQAKNDKPGIAFLQPDKMEAAIKAAHTKADLVVVFLHAGQEYAEKPDRRQVQFARGAVRAGADLVLGHHPHVIQRAEKYRGKYIFYSLGNFVFDQTRAQDTREGLMMKIFLNKKGVEKIEFYPVFINNNFQPQVMAFPQAKETLKKQKLRLKETPALIWDEENKVFDQSKRGAIFSFGQNKVYRISRIESFDLDNNGLNENYLLQDGRLSVTINSKTAFQSPASWWVENFTLGDINNDGIGDLILSVWKVGSYGKHKPFWLVQEDRSLKNHLFLFNLVNGSLKPVWLSSSLDQPNYELSVVDLDGNGKNELLVTEGSYTNNKVKQLSLWRWNGWGFSKITGKQ